MRQTSESKIPTGVKISMYIAFAGGILTPLLETVRRWDQMFDLRYFMSWFDDYLIGAVLFFSAWKTYQSVEKGLPFLIAACGLATGLIFSSFFSQLQRLNQPDPAPVSSGAVAFIKGIMLAICIVNLFLLLKERRHDRLEKT